MASSIPTNLVVSFNDPLYRVVTDLMVSFGLVMEHDKSEIFHFSRAHNDSNPELDLLAIGAPTLKPKTYWRLS